jgi:hypothetical protein
VFVEPLIKRKPLYSQAVKQNLYKRLYHAQFRPYICGESAAVHHNSDTGVLGLQEK